MPVRIQRRRTKGWRMPENTVYVGRPTRWGNPWPATTYGQEGATQRFREYLEARRNPTPGWVDVVDYPSDDEIREELGGKNLACWCREGTSCHVDVLFPYANQED